MSQQTIESTLRAVAEYSGNFTDPAAAARLAAPQCRLDVGGNAVVPTDARSTLASVLQRIAAENPDIAKAAPQAVARGNVVNDPGVIALMEEAAAERKSTDALRGIFGAGSDATRAAALMRTSPSEYRRLKQLAVAAGLL